MKNPLIKLNNNISIPQLGLGTADIGNFEKTKNVIKNALKIGYRYFDTASMYKNEKAIGTALQESEIPRNKITIATKLNVGDFGKENTKEAFYESLRKLDLNYIDIYLQHWPVENKRLESWEIMESLFKEGKIKAIGVSNYTIDHLKELLENSSVLPVINQVEFNPFLFQKQLLSYCRDNNILLQAYSPFSKGKTLKREILSDIANKYDKTPAQVILRWSIQLGISVIPKASTKEHLLENIDVFDFVLKPNDMEVLSQLNEDFRIEWNPNTVP